MVVCKRLRNEDVGTTLKSTTSYRSKTLLVSAYLIESNGLDICKGLKHSGRPKLRWIDNVMDYLGTMRFIGFCSKSWNGLLTRSRPA